MSVSPGRGAEEQLWSPLAPPSAYLGHKRAAVICSMNLLMEGVERSVTSSCHKNKKDDGERVLTKYSGLSSAPSAQPRGCHLTSQQFHAVGTASSLCKGGKRGTEGLSKGHRASDRQSWVRTLKDGNKKEKGEQGRSEGNVTGWQSTPPRKKLRMV